MTAFSYPYDEIGNFASHYVLVSGLSAITNSYHLPVFVYRGDATGLYELLQQLYFFHV